LIDALSSTGKYAEAIVYAQRYLAIDPLAEDIHRQLIELYCACGNRPGALKQYQTCSAILERELGVRPLPQTVAIYQTILHNAPPAEITEPGFYADNILSRHSMPFWGRDEPLGQLSSILHQAHSSKGQSVIIYGEPGIGKTRLLHDFIRRVQHRTIVLTGSADPSTQTLPYHPIAQAVRSIIGWLDPSSGIHSSWLAEICRLLPELQRIYPNLPSPLLTETEEARVRLFEALSQTLLSLSTPLRPLLLCLDDLHWADSITHEWLAYFGRKAANSAVIFLGTCLDEESSRLEGLCQSLMRSSALSEIHLSGLEEDSILHIIHNLEKAPPDSSKIAHKLKNVTGGNPFFITEILKSFAESGKRLMDLDEYVDANLPPTILHAIQDRIGRVSPMARQVLEAGAVQREGFDFNRLSQTAGRSDIETLDGLDELLGRQLLEEDGRVFRFHHELIKIAVYQNLSAWRRQLLHRRAAEALERLAPHDHASLAYHFERAGSPRKAAEHFLAARESMKNIFADREARASFDRALLMLEKENIQSLELQEIKANQHLRIQSLAGRGWAHRLLGDMTEYETDLQQEEELASQLKDELALAHLRWRQAACHRWFCRFHRSIRAAQEGILLSLRVEDISLQARCLRELGVSWREIGKYDRAQENLEQALQLFEETGDEVLRVHTLGNLSTLHAYQGRFLESMNLSQQALRLCERHKLTIERRLPLGDMGAAALGMGNLRIAQDYLLESLSIARQIDDRTQEIFCLAHLGWLNIRNGQARQAIKYLQDALNLAERIDSRNEQSRLQARLAQAYLFVDDPQGATEHALRALDLANGRRMETELARQVLAKLN